MRYGIGSEIRICVRVDFWQNHAYIGNMKGFAKIDNFGRIVIPKKVRADLGLGPNSVLVIEEKDDEISLRPVSEKAELVNQHGVLVANVKPTADMRTAVERLRQARSAQVSGHSSK